jgi:hypothetical protein
VAGNPLTVGDNATVFDLTLQELVDTGIVDCTALEGQHYEIYSFRDEDPGGNDVSTELYGVAQFKVGVTGCPVIRDLTSTPNIIPPGPDQSLIEVDAFDPDGAPEPLTTTLSASSGVFADKNASTTIYTCGSPGPAEICVRVSDGNSACDQQQCITVQCPSAPPPP